MLERDRSISTDSIRESARLILDQSVDILTLDYTAIDRDLIPLLTDFQKERRPISTAENTPLQRELGVVLFYDVVNFCFKDPATGNEYSVDINGKKFRRSSALQTAIRESDVDWNNLISVAALSEDKWKKITQLNSTNTLYLGEERGTRIRGFARHLLDKGFKTVFDFVKSTDLDTGKMLAFLSESGYFKDEFLKRAQLTVWMLQDVFKSHNSEGFKNTALLTAMADYRIPQVFYNLGIIQLSPALHQKLQSEVPIISESREERALRATVITVSEYVSGKMGINEAEVDSLLWPLSQKMARENKLAIPHMLVATDKC